MDENEEGPDGLTPAERLEEAHRSEHEEARAEEEKRILMKKVIMEAKRIAKLVELGAPTVIIAREMALISRNSAAWLFIHLDGR